MSKKKTGLNNARRQRISDRVLILTLFVQILILINQSMGLYAVAAQSMQASIIEPSGETLKVHIGTDTGRLNLVETLLSRARDWVGSYYVGGVVAQSATTGITISVTGSNVASTAYVDYYIKAVPQSGGTPFKFLAGNSTSITVGGSSLTPSNQTSIVNHLTAMGLSTTASHTIDYYVYVKATVTGAVSGETLTSEIVETKFDTVFYEFSDPGVWRSITVMKSTGYMGYVRHEQARVYKPTISDNQDVLFGESASSQYSCYMVFDNPGIPANSIIHEAYLGFYNEYGSTNPAQRVLVTAFNGNGWLSTYVTTYADWTSRWNSRVPVNVTWNAPTFVTGNRYNTTDIGPVIQARVDAAGYTSSGRLTLFVANDGDPQSIFKYAHGWGYSGKSSVLYVRYSSYSASWYPLPPMSLAKLPITLDVIALTALIAATFLAFRENRRNNI